MDEDSGPLDGLPLDLDGAVAELVHQGSVVGWVAVRLAPFRSVSLVRQVGCWILVTWADGSVDMEEDYPPFALLPELLAGGFHDDRRGISYTARWVAADRRPELWGLYGVHEEPGHYVALARQQRRERG